MDTLDTAARVSAEIAKTGHDLLKQNASTGIKYLLLDSITRDNLVKIFNKLGYPVAANQLEDLSELVDFWVKEE